MQLRVIVSRSRVLFQFRRFLLLSQVSFFVCLMMKTINFLLNELLASCSNLFFNSTSYSDQSTIKIVFESTSRVGVGSDASDNCSSNPFAALVNTSAARVNVFSLSLSHELQTTAFFSCSTLNTCLKRPNSVVTLSSFISPSKLSTKTKNWNKHD